MSVHTCMYIHVCTDMYVQTCMYIMSGRSDMNIIPSVFRSNALPTNTRFSVTVVGMGLKLAA